MNWPARLNLGSPRDFNLLILHHSKTKFESNPESVTEFHEPSEWLLGYAIPPFQRAVVWDEERMVRFVESAILGMNLGTWTYNSTMNLGPHRKDASGKEVWECDLWLIDGQQRLTALDRYWSDAFPVFGSYWSEVSERDQRRLLMSTHFPAFETQMKDEAQLRDLYDRMNFGGIAHSEDQRALPRI